MHNFSFDIRKEFFYKFKRVDPGYMEAILRFWTFRVTKRLPIISNQKNSTNRSPDGPFSLTFGLMASGNDLRDEDPSESAMKVFPTIGAEYEIRSLNMSLYLRRAMWLNIEAFDFNFRKTSQLNYLGVSYWWNVTASQQVKIGLHHIWDLDKAILFLDYVESNGYKGGRFTQYENFGVGLDLRYSLNKNWDATMDLDYYYKANPRLGTGFNAESFRLGLLYNLY